MTAHTRLAVTPRDCFLEAVEKEMIQFERREIEFHKKDRAAEYIYQSRSQKFASIREAASVGGFVAPDQNDNRCRLLRRLGAGQEAGHQLRRQPQHDESVLGLFREASYHLDGVPAMREILLHAVTVFLTQFGIAAATLSTRN